MGLKWNAETGQYEVEGSSEVQLPAQTQIGNIKLRDAVGSVLWSRSSGSSKPRSTRAQLR